MVKIFLSLLFVITITSCAFTNVTSPSRSVQSEKADDRAIEYSTKQGTGQWSTYAISYEYFYDKDLKCNKVLNFDIYRNGGEKVFNITKWRLIRSKAFDINSISNVCNQKLDDLKVQDNQVTLDYHTQRGQLDGKDLNYIRSYSYTNNVNKNCITLVSDSIHDLYGNPVPFLKKYFLLMQGAFGKLVQKECN